MRWLIGLGMLAGVVLSAGCTAALLGGGMLGGIIISDDSVEYTFSADLQEVWKTCIDYLSQNGEIVKIDKEKGIIYAEKVFGKDYVQIQVEGKPAGTNTVVKARKMAKLLPDVDTAVKIMGYLIKRLEK